MSDFMKKPCEHCPFRRDVKPFLHPSRGEDLANSALNPHNTFPCHKTTEADPKNESEMRVVEHSKICAGFLSLQYNENGETWYDGDGFEPSSLVYEDAWTMTDSYQEEWDNRR